MHRINIGCGMTPTKGWLNFDNSLSVRLAAYTPLAAALGLLGILNAEQAGYVAYCRLHKIAWADATRRIPLGDGSVEVLYSSHVLEHLTPDQAAAFLGEAKRVLEPGGVIRLAVPDLARLARRYADDGDADLFVDASLLAMPVAAGWRGRLAALVAGPRHHLWMYDGRSLAGLLRRHGFMGASVLGPGETIIADPGTLDLHERADESVYVEALRP